MRKIMEICDRVAMLPVLFICLLLMACNRNRDVPPSSGVRMAVLLWQTGINGPGGPTPLLEAITPVVMHGHQGWRVTHYSTDPSSSSANEYDLYDIDAATLRPYRSVMQTDEFRLEIDFEEQAATLHKTDKDGDHVEEIPLATEVKPEGPGFTAFVAGLPLRESYTTQYHVLDRWGGSGPSRLKLMTLRVTGRKQVATAMGMKNVFEVDTRAADGSFEIQEYVRTLPPYYPYWLKYTRGPMTSVSEVTSMVFQHTKDQE